MCGIVGILGGQREQAEARDIVQKMMCRIAHRGPDGEGLYSDKNAALGHRRLAIIDLEHGIQPVISADGRFVLVFNGEIYNYLELRQNLIQRGVSLRTFSDSEVLLYMLVHEGKDALRQLNGMFSFAFLDTTNGEWLLARDPFGIKPLYFYQFGDELIFASEIKALFAHPAMRAELNWDGLNQYFAFQFCMGAETLFHGVRKVEPGCVLRGVHGKIIETVRYWDTNYHVDDHHTEAYFIDKLQALLEDSARLQIRSDVPLGSYLSGGLDSTVIAALAAGKLGNSLPVFTGRFAEGPEYDESTYAKLAAKEFGGIYHEIVPTPQDFVDCMPSLIHSMDEPVAGPGLFPQYMVSREASRHVKVILGGQGGDELFGGYARYLVGYLEQALKGAILETQEEGRHLVSLASIIPNLPLLKQYRPMMQQFLQQGLFEDMDRRYFRLIERSPDIEGLLTQEAMSRLDREQLFAEFQKVFNHPDTKSYFNKMTHFDLKTSLPALLQVEDRVSMAASLESRVPFLDTRIVDLVSSMPPQLKFQGGKTKHILKMAVENLVPEPILKRKDKMGFPVPLKEWMQGGVVRDFVTDTLLSRRSLERGIFRPDALEGMLHKQGVGGRQLWGALCLELWHQRFMDDA